MIFDIKRFAVHDGPGIRCTVFLKGCLAHCWWCHNPESQLLEPEMTTKKQTLDGRSFVEKEIVGKIMSVGEVMTEIKKDTIYYDESGGGVTLSGGEPLMQAEFLSALVKSCRKEKIHTALDTSGYASTEILRSLIDLIDLYLFDIKIINDEL